MLASVFSYLGLSYQDEQVKNFCITMFKDNEFKLEEMQRYATSRVKEKKAAMLEETISMWLTQINKREGKRIRLPSKNKLRV